VAVTSGTDTARELWTALEEVADRERELDQATRESLREDIATAVEMFSEVAGQLKAAFHIVPQLHDRLASPQATNELASALESDTERRERMRVKIEELCAAVSEAEVLSRHSQQVRDLEARLADGAGPEFRRDLHDLFQRMRAVGKEVDEWCKSARRGLEKVGASALAKPLDLRELLAEFGSARPESGNGAASGSPSRRKGAKTSSPRPASESAPDSADSTLPKPSRGPGHTVHGVRREDAEFAWASLRRLARRNLRVPLDLPSRVRIRRSRETLAKILTVRRFVARRRVLEGSLDAKRLWDIPIGIPEATGPRCSRVVAVDGAVIEVQWAVETRECFFCEGKLPRERISREDGKPVLEKSVDGRPGTGRIESCLDLVSAHFGPIARDEIARFIDTESSDGENARVERVALEMVVVPVREIVCGPTESSASERGEFTMWVYGQKPRFHAEGYPRTLTLRLLGVLAGVAIAAFAGAWYLSSAVEWGF